MLEAAETDCLRLEEKAQQKDKEEIRFEFNDAVLDYMEAHNLKAWEITDALRNQIIKEAVENDDGPY